MRNRFDVGDVLNEVYRDMDGMRSQRTVGSNVEKPTKASIFSDAVCVPTRGLEDRSWTTTNASRRHRETTWRTRSRFVRFEGRKRVHNADEIK